MRIIAEREEEVKVKGLINIGGNKMKKIVIAVLIAVALMNTSSAFSYWKSPAGSELKDPAPCPFDNNKF